MEQKRLDIYGNLLGILRLATIFHNSPDCHNIRRDDTCSAKSNRKRYGPEIADHKKTTAAVGDFGELFKLMLFGECATLAPTLCNGGGYPPSGCAEKLPRWVGHSGPSIESV